MVSRRRFLELAAGGASLAIAAGEASSAEVGLQEKREWTPNWISGKPSRSQIESGSIALQPLAQQTREIESAFAYLGEPFSSSATERITRALSGTEDNAVITELQKVLDRRVLVDVRIDRESRGHVTAGSAPPELVELGTRLFL